MRLFCWHEYEVIKKLYTIKLYPNAIGEYDYIIHAYDAKQCCKCKKIKTKQIFQSEKIYTREYLKCMSQELESLGYRLTCLF